MYPDRPVDLRPYFPYLPENKRKQSHYMQKLKDKTEKLKERFTSLVFELQKDIEKSTTLVKDVITLLNLNPKLEELLKDCRNLTEVFRTISKYVSFFDYRLIRTLARKFGSATTIKRLKVYMQKFQEYSKSCVCECPSDAFGDVEDSEKVYAIKIDRSIQTLTVDELEKLEYEMNKILGHELLRLLKVEEGCVKLLFRTFQYEDWTITEEQQQALRRHGVLSIKYGNKAVNIDNAAIPVEGVQNEFSGKNANVMVIRLTEIIIFVEIKGDLKNNEEHSIKAMSGKNY